jgi:hypothetical protein
LPLTSWCPEQCLAQRKHSGTEHVILATQEAERITVQSQPGQVVLKTLSRKNTSQ